MNVINVLSLKVANFCLFSQFFQNLTEQQFCVECVEIRLQDFTTGCTHAKVAR